MPPNTQNQQQPGAPQNINMQPAPQQQAQPTAGAFADPQSQAGQPQNQFPQSTAQQPQPSATQSQQGNNSQPAQKSNPNSTQNTLLISEIRDNMVIMRDGSFRAVVACKSINFDLMSSREREGVEFSYQNFINSLNFNVQIYIRSQRVDIGPYIDRLVKIRQAQDNMLLNVLMDDYIDFIDILSQEANIMDKSFFIIVPYSRAGDVSDVKNQTKGFFTKLFAKTPDGPTKIDQTTFEKAKDEIRNRIDLVTSGLFQMGVQSVQLTTKELGELYYNVYNPDTAVREPLGDFEHTTSTFVRKGQSSENQAQRPYIQTPEELQ